MTREEITKEAEPYFVGAELFDGYVGQRIIIEGNDVVLLFSDANSDELLGARFRGPVLPTEGLAYRGVMMRTPRDWILDLKVVLNDELGTGLAIGSGRTSRSGWTELSIPADHWETGDSDGTLEEWTDS